MFKTNNQIVKDLQNNQPVNMLNSGGEWLGKARSWIQWTATNGDNVDWGSDDVVELKTLHVSDIEAFAARIAKATLQEFTNNLVTTYEKEALKIYSDPENWSRRPVTYDEPIPDLKNIFNPNQDNLHFACPKIKNGWELGVFYARIER